MYKENKSWSVAIEVQPPSYNLKLSKDHSTIFISSLYPRQQWILLQLCLLRLTNAMDSNAPPYHQSVLQDGLNLFYFDASNLESCH